MSTAEHIRSVLEKVRPYLHADGGDIEFVAYDEATGVCEVRFLKECSHCSISPLTLRAGVERALKREVSKIKRVESVK